MRRTAIIFFATALCTLRTAAADAPVDLDSLRGRVVYLDFWASWCGPCRQSFPWMQQMQDTYGQQGLTIVAVDVDRDRKDAEKFLSEFRPSFTVRFDPKGGLAERFKVAGMPTGVLIDRHGAVRHTHIGFRPTDRTQYESQLRELLNEK